jgi:hypothetical protein
VRETTQAAENQIQAALASRSFANAKLQTFLFQDTIILVYDANASGLTIADFIWFGHVLRDFQARSLEKNLLFRGAVAAGELFAISSETNTILGPGVRDAARSYDRADWIGIHATPRTSILIRATSEAARESLDSVFERFPVPLKSGGSMELEAVNWPKALHLRYGRSDATTIRAVVAQHLAFADIPIGVEQKHFQALKFFDFIVDHQRLHESFAQRQSEAAANPLRR